MQAGFTKRINELLVLAVLKRGPAHGYQVALSVEEDTGGAFSFQHGTLYPILHRLESDGRVEGQWDEQGRRRKIYAITDRGSALLKEDSAQLEQELGALFSLLSAARSDAA